MMTERQAKILAAIIEQYAELATPVGSVLLAKLFDVSPATMRSEMAKLEEMGYLRQPHTSAGRVPTGIDYMLTASPRPIWLASLAIVTSATLR